MLGIVRKMTAADVRKMNGGAKLRRMVRRFACLGLLVSACVGSPAQAQTPSPLQEWQYSSGIALEKLFVPNLADWRVVLGGAAIDQPLYDGAELTRTRGGPVIRVAYKDIAFASIGEGLGLNLVHGAHYRGGVALCFDLGREMSEDISNLHGLGDIGRTGCAKVFFSYAVSRSLPLVVRADMRQLFAGAGGLLGDVGVFMPLPGSSERFFMFAGPSITWADHHYMQTVFGVTPTQSIDSGHPVYDAHAGSESAGFGLSAELFITPHWFIDMDTAASRLLGSAAESPITQRTTDYALSLSLAYQW
jgi:outer membrane scaffolding protein for murein synthesis (MipA/OmpV family)